MKRGNAAFSRAELNHLINLLINAQVDGSYYGNRKQYYARTARLLALLAARQALIDGSLESRYEARRHHAVG